MRFKFSNILSFKVAAPGPRVVSDSGDVGWAPQCPFLTGPCCRAALAALQAGHSCSQLMGCFLTRDGASLGYRSILKLLLAGLISEREKINPVVRAHFNA